MNKVVLVTGSSQGIGAGVAKLFGEKGYTVIVTYRKHKDKASNVAEDIKTNGGKTSVVQLDVTSEKSVKECFDFVASEFGRLDVLVNNAGVDGLSPIESVTFDRWKEIVGPKIDGNFLCTKYALPLLKKAKKSDLIVIMSSLGDRPDVEDIAYSVGTAGAVGFVKAMALALAKYGIRTNGVGPNETRTNLDYWREAGLTSDKAWEEMARNNPLGRVATTEDIAQTILTIVENPTQFWNGNFIYVTGGSHIPRTGA
ncbi:MAG TPA: SDR family oxidoreductase [Candidatus Saccharimonadales bacterium]|nr:SDR family oxidoreductase [Candidatus Saccharimonadales bacterium]